MENLNLKEDILKLHKEGKSYKEICEILKCGKSIVYYYINPEVKERQIKRHARERKGRINDIKISKGGCCEVCGYNNCFAALEFHHLDSSKKDFGIANYRNKKIEELVIEINKCAILCANCHREVHEGILDISNYQFKLITENEVIEIKNRISERVNLLRPLRKSGKDNKLFNVKKICKCGNIKSTSNTKLCQTCYNIERKSEWPSKQELEELIWKDTLANIAKRYNVTDESVIYWCSVYKIKRPSRGYSRKISKAQERAKIIKKEELQDLLKQYSHNSISKQLGITKYLLCKIIKDYNI